MLTRAVSDAAGKPVGLVGAVLPQASLEALISPDWLAPQISLALLGGAGGELLPHAADRARMLDGPDSRTQRLMLSLLAWFGQPTSWTGTAPLHTIAAAVAATLPTGIALPRHELSGPVIVSGCTLLAAWLVCVLLVVAARRKSSVEPVPTGFGADWQCDLEAAGIVVAQYGNLPEALRDGVGQPLLTALGPQREAGAAGTSRPRLQQRATLTDVQVRLDDQHLAARLGAGEGRRVRLHRPRHDRRGRGAGGARCRRDRAGGGAAQPGSAADLAGARHPHADDQHHGHLRAAAGWRPGARAAGVAGAGAGKLRRAAGDAERPAGGVRGRDARAAPWCAEPVDVSTLVQEVVDMLRPQARDKALELHTRCDDLLRGQWMVDPSRLRQVVFNLASNAVKYTAAGRVEIRASAVEVDGQSRLRIAVSDTGPGIDPAEREEIFERFRRGRAHEGSSQGGLGPRAGAVPGECAADGRHASRWKARWGWAASSPSNARPIGCRCRTGCCPSPDGRR